MWKKIYFGKFYKMYFIFIHFVRNDQDNNESAKDHNSQ